MVGLWNHEDVQDRSQWLLILVGGCLVAWKTKIPTEIAMSTIEGEYAALSTSLKNLSPLQSKVKNYFRKSRNRCNFKAYSI